MYIDAVAFIKGDRGDVLLFLKDCFVSLKLWIHVNQKNQIYKFYFTCNLITIYNRNNDDGNPYIAPESKKCYEEADGRAKKNVYLYTDICEENTTVNTCYFWDMIIHDFFYSFYFRDFLWGPYTCWSQYCYKVQFYTLYKSKIHKEVNFPLKLKAITATASLTAFKSHLVPI